MTLELAELWLQYAKDDLIRASILFKEGIWAMACFHSQQAVEKTFKSIIAGYHEEIPRTHNLIRLQNISENLLNRRLEIHEENLLFLNDVYIDSRYPADFGLLPSCRASEADAHRALSSADQIFHYLTGIRKN